MAKYVGIDVLVSRTAESCARLTAIEEGERSVTYRELEARAEWLSDLLARRGVTSGSTVAILASSAIDIVTAVLAILKARGAFVTLDRRFPDRRLELMIEQVEPACILVGRGDLVRLEDIAPRAAAAGRVLVLEEALAHSDPERVLPAARSNADPDSLCNIFFTSGSTGRPKPIAGRLKGIEHYIQWQIDAFGARQGTRVSQLASVSFDGFVKDVFVALCAGGTLCAPADREALLDPARLVDWIDSARIHLLCCVPTVFRSVLNQNLRPDHFPELTIVGLGGEVMQPADVARWKRVFGERVQLVNLYGPTETTMVKMAYFVQPGDENRSAIPLGKPIRGAAAIICDANGRPCPSGMVGEILIRTPFRSLGYYRQPELTREVFVQNPFSNDPEDLVYKTGDFGRMLEDGTFEFLGRRDDQVKIRGVRVELKEVENLLRTHPALREVAVIALEDTAGDSYLAAYVVVTEPAAVAALREYARERLPPALVPSVFVALDALPRTLTGKIDRRALPPPAAVPEALATSKGPARGPIEEVVAGIWCEVLGRDRVGLEDDFFEIGGHSLLAVRVLSRLRRTFEVELPLEILFTTPTVVSLAAAVAAGYRGSRAMAPPITRLPRDGRLALSCAQQRLWFMEQLAPGGSAYNLPVAIRLSGRCDLSALWRAFAGLVARHETLRTTFHMEHSDPALSISPPGPPALALADLSALPEPERALAAEALLYGEARQPFDLARGPLLRTLLLRLSGDCHLCLITLHHIVADAWSVGVLVRELAVLYHACPEDRRAPLAELPVQYVDFASWQQRWLEGGGLDAQLEYWRQHLAGLTAGVKLPPVKPQPAVPSIRGASRSRLLSPELAAELRLLGRRESATLFMVLVSGLLVLLHWYTGELDMVIGTDDANRNRAETEGMIGFFINQLVLRTDLAGDPTFRELLARARKVALGAFAHNELPFDRLVEALNPQRSRHATPLFHVKLVLQNVPMEPVSLPGLTLTPLDTDRADADLDLTLFVLETAAGLRTRANFRTDLYDAQAIDAFLAGFDAVLRAAAADPSQRLTDLRQLLTSRLNKELAAALAERRKLPGSGFGRVEPRVVEMPTEL